MGDTMTFREKIRAKREKDFGLETALAAHIRQRWPDKPIVHVQHEWGLSESEASKAAYGQASKNTLNKLLHHKRGGFSLFIDLLADATSTTIEQYVHRMAEEARNERTRWEAEERRQAALAARLSGLGGGAGRPAESAGRRR